MKAVKKFYKKYTPVGLKFLNFLMKSQIDIVNLVILCLYQVYYAAEKCTNLFLQEMTLKFALSLTIKCTNCFYLDGYKFPVRKKSRAPPPPPILPRWTKQMHILSSRIAFVSSSVFIKSRQINFCFIPLHFVSSFLSFFYTFPQQVSTDIPI
jgi:hypothetical protein